MINYNANFRTEAEAKACEAEILARYALGNRADRRLTEKTTLRELLQRYLDEYVPNYSDAEREARRVNDLMKRKISSLFVASVRPADVADFVKERAAEGVNGNTIKHDIAVLSRVFNVACGVWGYDALTSNPTKNVILPKISRGRERRLKDGEEQRLLDAASEKFRPVGGPGWKISELQQRLGVEEFRPPRANIAEIAAAVRAKHPLGELKLDDDVELHNDCSDIDKEIAATGTPTRTSPKPMPTEMKKLQDISPTPLVHRPFRTDFGPNSRAVLSRRSTDPTPEQQKFSETLAQRVAKYAENIPLAPAPIMETIGASPATKRTVSKSNSSPLRHKSYLPPATFRFRSLRNLRPSRRISAWAASRSWVVLYRERMNYRNRIAMARAWAVRKNETTKTKRTEIPATETPTVFQ